MANYKDIHGTQIETVSSNPDNPANGQVWYNSTDQALRGFTSNPAGAWSTQPSLNTARFQGAGAGTQTSALAFGGEANQSPSQSDHTESWNGTSWTEVNDLNAGKTYLPISGTYTSAITGGGLGPPSTALTVCESWNGTSWTEVADINTGDGGRVSFGEDNSNAVTVGGAVTEKWNGTSWSEIVDKNVNAGSAMAGDSPAGAGFVFGGSGSGSPQHSGSTEQFTSPVISTVTFTVS